MNGSTWLIAFAGAILVLLCGGHRLVPQSVEGGRAKDVSPTRVAIVNVGAFLKEYSRARQIRAELEAHLMPYKNKAKPLQGDVETLQRELRTTTDPDRQRALENAIKAKKQGLEELSKEVVQLLEKRQEENTKTLWGEMQAGIAAIAKAHGYQIVLGFSKPGENNLPAASRHRELQAMDLGALTPLHLQAAIDITDLVLRAAESARRGAVPAP